MRWLSIWCFLLPVIACASFPSINGPNEFGLRNCDEKFQAEYRLMKNNLNLAMRENEVVKGENGQLKDNVSALQTDLASLHQKYDQDMASMTGKLESLQVRFQDLETQSNAKIQELTDLHLAVENKLAQETTRFEETLKTQQEKSNSERQAMESDFAAQKADYENRLALLSKDLNEKQTALTALKKDHTKAKSKIETMQKTIADNQKMMGTMQKSIDDYNATLATMRKSLDENQTALAAKQKTIDENQAALAAKQKSIDEYKATVAALQQTIQSNRTAMAAMQQTIDDQRAMPENQAPQASPVPAATQQTPAE